MTSDIAWKEFYRAEREGIRWQNDYHITRKVIDTCQRVQNERFTKEGQQILHAFYDRHWGDGIFAIEEYAKSNGMTANYCWSVISKARRELMIELELIERERRFGNGNERE